MGMREKLIELLENAPGQANNEVYSLAEIVDHLIANGVTIPVLCKDCKNREHVWCPMESVEQYPWLATKDDDFCSYGERKNNGL